LKTIELRTEKRCAMVDITNHVEQYVKESAVKSGLVCVFVPHTTAGVSINENADPDVTRDIMFALERMVPCSGFLHMEGNSDAHTKAHITGFSLTVIVENGRLQLGTWQGIYFCEFDGPRQRRVYIKVL